MSMTIPLRVSRTVLAAFVAALFLPALGCADGRTALQARDGGAAAGAPDAGAPADGRIAGRVPLNHRSTGGSCPAQRGSGPLDCGCSGTDGGCSCVQGACSQDSDCSAGINGRCQVAAALLFSVGCSYDACFDDSDCPDKVPCDCRASATDTGANHCLTGSNCRTDADCGPGGYCSPSLVDTFCSCQSTAYCNPDAGGGCYEFGADGTWHQVPCSCGDSCGHGYFCHTPGDTCRKDGDCASGETSNFDLPSQTWMCTPCWPIP